MTDNPKDVERLARIRDTKTYWDKHKPSNEVWRDMIFLSQQIASRDATIADLERRLAAVQSGTVIKGKSLSRRSLRPETPRCQTRSNTLMHIFFDTETTGLPDFRLPPNHPSQPHIVSLAVWLGEWRDGTLSHVASVNSVITPDGTYHFDPRAVAVHKITEEYTHAFGEPADVVLARFFALVQQAAASLDTDAPPLLIAHNFSFDHRMLLREMAHVGMDTSWLSLLRPFCTMRALTPRMRLPHPNGRRFPGADTYKWPRLDEAYAFMFDGAPVPGREDKHDAMTDTLACRDIYLEGRTREWWS